MSEKKVMLRSLDSQKSHQFDADHAERLLKYPGTRWEEVADKPDADTAKTEAAVAKPKRAAAADSTGMPEAV